MKLEIPQPCLVVLVGVSGAGKSTFARRHFLPTEVVSSDVCRGLVSDNENDQSATSDAFDVLDYIVGKRLARGKLTVVDATSVQAQNRKKLVQLARAHDCLAVAIVLNLPTKFAGARNEDRPDRNFGMRVIRQQSAQLRRDLRGMKREGFSRVHILTSQDEVDAVELIRRPLWNDRRDDAGPFDIIGDVHGCLDELQTLLKTLGYQLEGGREQPRVTPPPGRRALFLGDLIDRGPDSPGVLRLVMSMVESGAAVCIPGNHEVKLLKHLGGKKVRLSHGLQETVDQLAEEPEGFGAEVATFINGLVSHFVLDEGRLVVAHAGLKEAYQGRASGRVRAFCLYGETTGETDEFGIPVRYDWAREYRGQATVVYGHTPVPEPSWVNRTICIDTGCVFGGQLTALRYPEMALVAVEAARTYYEPARPLEQPKPPSRPEGVLDITDVTGARIVETRVRHSITIREENAVAALEVMSRFAVDPRWLIYLPPTMAPTATAPKDTALLERPEEAFEYYEQAGIERVVCEEKHMGSRAVLVVARTPELAAARFGVGDGKQGVVYTRRGRPFFADDAVEAALIARLAEAIERAGWWSTIASDWVCLDAELMPWSLKAVELLQSQYAAVGAAAQAALAEVERTVAQAAARGVELGELPRHVANRRAMVESYSQAWRRYCWKAEGLEGVRLAPFHILAAEGRTFFEHSQIWHMDQLAKLAAQDEALLVATKCRVVELADQAQREAAAAWWREMTDAGGEGMVVKPEHWLARGPRGLVQPALKCRGPAYLRIIYGPEYSAPDNLERLRPRKLGVKRSLALREFALGVEALQRVAEGEPLWRVHEAVFGVLALESEPVDPRL
ncbi:polynucleotide kinase-phosphatase [Pseudenhygromyxa sp. WMMC2535]|uniref:polynucleotide kinase-phosphatase n=1 Tax=Pseudenhygromyxa sp. WMMC2535 TaxID=2712867 RepID=UPI001552E4EF|nr:polynucleotide kinase-phosphatase [Pseudenhygromyxa sp. WMMC2535]NVB39558.1 polynucleotide kinase-phosphatase [Pseudenhygromyxa sp. WMMC2535]